MQQERFPQGLEADNSVRGEEREAKWVRQVGANEGCQGSEGDHENERSEGE